MADEMVYSYMVTVEDGDCSFDFPVIDTSRSSAKWRAFVSSGYAEWSVPFFSFLKLVKSVKKLKTPPGSYGYIKDSYGLDVSPGEKIKVLGRPALAVQPLIGYEQYVQFVYADSTTGATYTAHPCDVSREELQCL